MFKTLTIKELESIYVTLMHYNKYIACIYRNAEGEVEMFCNEIPYWEKYTLVDRKTIVKQIKYLKNGK